MNVHDDGVDDAPNQTSPSSPSDGAASTSAAESEAPRFRWAVLGPGSIAHRFAGQLPQSSHGALYAVGSSDAQRAQGFAEQYGAQLAGGYQRVLAAPEVDAVYIATVHTGHAQLTLAALQAGKHVLCEKPLAPNHGSVMAMLDAAAEHERVLLEAYMYQFHPVVRQVFELIKAGEIGQVQHIDASFSYRSGSMTGRLFEPELAGGGILDVGGYPVSAVQAIVRAAGHGSGVPDRLRAAGSLTDAGVDQWAVASMDFGDRVSAHVRTGTRVSDPSVLSVYGSGGAIHMRDPWTMMSQDAGVQVLPVAADGYSIPITPAAAYAAEADAVAQAAREGLTEVPGFDARTSSELALVLDSWRAELGEVYPFEADEADIAPLRDLQRPHPGVSIGQVSIDGVGGLSRLVLGCDNQQNLAHASALFDAFYASGGSTFDTAYIYGGGRQEYLLGRWLANRGLRDEVQIIAKGAHTPHCDPQSLSAQLDVSLDRLGVESVELYMLHRDNPDIPVGEFVTALNAEVDAGRIGAFGGSNWTVQRIAEANAWAQDNGLRGFSVLSNHFGLARALDVPWAGCEHVTDPESRQWLEEHQFPLIPWSAQARGFFVRANPEDRSDAELVRCYYAEDNFERLSRATELAQQRGVAPTAIALAYVLAQPFPTLPLIGPRSIAELRDSMRALTVELTGDEVAWLDLRER